MALLALTISLLCAPAYGTYFVYGDVFASDGTSGTAAAENSYGSLAAYRTGISGQIASEHSTNTPPSLIYPAYSDSGTDYAAYYNTDTGSDWTTPAAAGQVLITVVEVVKGRYGWTGDGYSGAVAKTLSGSELSSVIMPAMRLENIPVPAAQSVSTSGVTLTWTGMSHDEYGLITGYSVYRSMTQGSGYVKLSPDAAHLPGGTVSYSDNNVAMGAGYYYRLAVNYEWDGTGNTVTQYTTQAMSADSAEIDIPGATKTVTQTSTATSTFTPTDTPSGTYTSTVTPTFTLTITDTLTCTPTYTPTSTYTVTPTVTLSATPTITPYQTLTNTPTPDLAAISAARDRLIVFNNPVRNGKIKAGFYSDRNASAIIRIYSMTGELVRSFKMDANTGSNLFECAFDRFASGVYILKVNIDGVDLPERKIGVIQGGR